MTDARARGKGDMSYEQSNFLNRQQRLMIRAEFEREGISVRFKTDYAGQVFGVLSEDKKVLAYTRSMPTLEDAIFEAHKAVDRQINSNH